MNALLIISLSLFLQGCKVQLEAPDQPIVVHLNIKIQQEVLLKVENDVVKLIEKHREIY